MLFIYSCYILNMCIPSTPNVFSKKIAGQQSKIDVINCKTQNLKAVGERICFPMTNYMYQFPIVMYSFRLWNYDHVPIPYSLSVTILQSHPGFGDVGPCYSALRLRRCEFGGPPNSQDRSSQSWQTCQLTPITRPNPSEIWLNSSWPYF